MLLPFRQIILQQSQNLEAEEQTVDRDTQEVASLPEPLIIPFVGSERWATCDLCCRMWTAMALQRCAGWHARCIVCSALMNSTVQASTCSAQACLDRSALGLRVVVSSLPDRAVGAAPRGPA